jgi:hypothetical protein
MLRSIIAVIICYVVWSVLWVAFNVLLKTIGMLPPDDTMPVSNVTSLIVLLLGSFAFSVIAGYVAAAIKTTSSVVPIAVLGILLLASGIFAELQYWQLMPVWYHVVFLAALIPLCFVGARIRRSK